MHTIPLTSTNSTKLMLAQLREAVAASSLSKTDLAQRAGLSRRALYALLEGTADPRLGTIETLANVLGLDLVLMPKIASNAAFHKKTTDRSAYTLNAELDAQSDARVKRMLETLK